VKRACKWLKALYPRRKHRLVYVLLGILRRLLGSGRSVVAGRLAGGFRNIGRDEIADRILRAMRSAGYTVHEVVAAMPNCLIESYNEGELGGSYMAIHTRVIAAVAAGLIFSSSAAIGDDATPQHEKYSAAAENPSCLTHTGSRIGGQGTCRGTGRSYTNDDLKRTGKTTVGGALRLLDPSITVHH
jgi:hypothetical protein